MNTKFSRSLAVAALALTAGALTTGTAAAAPTTSAAPVAGSVEVCVPIPLGPVAVDICL